MFLEFESFIFPFKTQSSSTCAKGFIYLPYQDHTMLMYGLYGPSSFFLHPVLFNALKSSVQKKIVNILFRKGAISDKKLGIKIQAQKTKTALKIREPFECYYQKNTRRIVKIEKL